MGPFFRTRTDNATPPTSALDQYNGLPEFTLAGPAPKSASAARPARSPAHPCVGFIAATDRGIMAPTKLDKLDREAATIASPRMARPSLIEASNIMESAITLEPGEKHTMTAVLSVTKL